MERPKPNTVTATTRPVVPWNKGGIHRAQAAAEAQAGLVHPLQSEREGRLRDLALFDLAIDSKLRGCDLVRLCIGQVVMNAAARHRATIVQQKAGKPVQFALTEQTRDSLIAWLTHRGGGLQEYVFPSRTDGTDHLGTRR